MKVFYIYIALQLIILLSRAEDGPACAQKLRQGETQLNFHRYDFSHNTKDSVLIIYDRYDRSGAGVVFKVFYPSDDHNILVTAIPEGKYFVTIQCLGKHHDRFEKIVKIKSGKRAVIPIKLSDCDDYSKDKVVIPADHGNFKKLSIINMK